MNRREDESTSSRPKIFVTRLIPEPGLDVLRPACDVSIHPHDRPPIRDGLLAAVRGCDGLVATLADRVVAALLDAAPRFRVVANFAVGLFIPEAGYDTRLAREAGWVPGPGRWTGLGCRLWMRDRRAVGLYAVLVPRTRVSYS